MLRIGVLVAKNGGRRPPIPPLFKGRWSKWDRRAPRGKQPFSPPAAGSGRVVVRARAERRPAGGVQAPDDAIAAAGPGLERARVADADVAAAHLENAVRLQAARHQG